MCVSERQLSPLVRQLSPPAQPPLTGKQAAQAVAFIWPSKHFAGGQEGNPITLVWHRMHSGEG